MTQLALRGTRLAYVVVPLPGKVKREKIHLVTREVGKSVDRKGNKRYIIERKPVMVDEDAGFMVYFPRGHCLRIKSKKMLRRYNLNKPPKVINLDGLADPKNPINVLISELGSGAQHSGAFKQLEQAVIKLCQMRPGADKVTDAKPSVFNGEDGEDDEQAEAA